MAIIVVAGTAFRLKEIREAGSHERTIAVVNMIKERNLEVSLFFSCSILFSFLMVFRSSWPVSFSLVQFYFPFLWCSEGHGQSLFLLFNFIFLSYGVQKVMASLFFSCSILFSFLMVFRSSWPVSYSLVQFYFPFLWCSEGHGQSLFLLFNSIFLSYGV
jgi:hypothetical protein